MPSIEILQAQLNTWKRKYNALVREVENNDWKSESYIIEKYDLSYKKLQRKRKSGEIHRDDWKQDGKSRIYRESAIINCHK